LARTSRSAPSSSLHAHAHGAAVLHQHVEHAHALVRVDAVLARVLEHHLVELAAHDLPGLRALVRLVVPEVEGRRQLAVAFTNCTLYFLTKWLCCIFGSMLSRFSTQ
jgi:hypothetical protein